MGKEKSMLVILKAIGRRIISGYRWFATRLNSLADGDGFSAIKEEETRPASNETVLVGKWRLKILDADNNTVYSEQLIFNRTAPDNPDTYLPKIIGRYDKEYYDSIEIAFDSSYDINIKSIWKGAKHVHRLHAWLIYDKQDKSLTIEKCPRDEAVDNGMYNGAGEEIEKAVIQNGDRIRLGPSITLVFEKPGRIENAAPKKKPVKDVDETLTRRTNPGRMPGRGL